MMYTRALIPTLSILVIFCAALYSLLVPIGDDTLARFEGRVILEGMVAKDPDLREKTVRVTVRPEMINGERISGSGLVLISADRFADVRYGDTVRVVGVLQKPEAFETDTGRTFDYPGFLFAHGISYELPFAELEVVSRGDGNAVISWLISIKDTLVVGIERAYPEPYGALAKGLLLGEKQSLGDTLYDAFTASGLVHIVVLSGYNVALVIHSVLFLSLLFLPRLWGFALAAVFVVGFAVMTGGSETTVRATVMALIMMLARIVNRPAAALRGLLIAAALMAAWNPFLVLYDLSFQLSVLATLGLIIFSDPLSKRMPFMPERFGIREITATTLATQVTVLPLLILSIGAVSLVFLPANILALPLVPVAMLASFIAALVALLVPPLTLLVSFPGYVVLAAIIGIADFFGTLPFASLTVSASVQWLVLGVLALSYLAVFLFSARVLKLPRRSDS